MCTARCQRHTIGEIKRALVPHHTAAVGSKLQNFPVHLPEGAAFTHIQITVMIKNRVIRNTETVIAGTIREKRELTGSQIEFPDAFFAQITNGEPFCARTESEAEYEAACVGHLLDYPAVGRNSVNLTGFTTGPYRAIGVNRHTFRVIKPGGELVIEPPVAPPGSHVTLRAEMDAVVVFSACPQDMAPTNGADMMPKDAELQLL